MKRTGIISIFVLLIAVNLPLLHAAEDLDVMYFEYKYMVPSGDTINVTGEPSAGIDTSQYDISTMVKLPLYATEADKPVRILAIFRYDLIHADYRETGTGEDLLNSIETLHAVKFGLGSFVPLGPRAGMYFDLAGSINTDFNKIGDLDWKDVITTGNLMINYRYSSLFLQFGITSTSKFGRPMVLPIVGFVWKPVSWFHYKLRIPHTTSAWIQYKIFHGGIFASIVGNQFRLMRNGEANDYVTSLTMVETGLSMRVNVWNKMYIYSDLGVHAYRRLIVYDRNSSERAKISYSQDFTDTFFVRVGIAYSAI